MHTKTLICSLIAFVAAATHANAQLRFISGTVSNFSGVTLSLRGPTNLMCQVERLSRSNQTWQSMGTVRLSTNGNATFTSSLDEGAYGYFRAKATNGTYLSTNAFGALVGVLPGGNHLIGNPFGATTISSMLPEPVDGTVVYKYAQTNYQTSWYEFGEWTSDMPVSMCEGFIVQTPTNTTQRFICTGLIDTNITAKSLQTGFSLLCSPRYQLVSPSQWQVDLLSTNLLGGLSALPVASPGFATQCTITRMINPAGTYLAYSLTNTGKWLTNGVQTSVPLELGEGFWINKPTNSAWYIQRSIW